jgi:hypothetical protein
MKFCVYGPAPCRHDLLLILYVSYGAIYKSADNKTNSNAYMFRNENKLISLPVALPSSPMPKLTEKNVISLLPNKVSINQLKGTVQRVGSGRS